MGVAGGEWGWVGRCKLGGQRKRRDKRELLRQGVGARAAVWSERERAQLAGGVETGSGVGLAASSI